MGEPMIPTVYAEPTVEPVSLDEIKEHLRLATGHEEDGLLLAAIRTARRLLEQQTGRTLISTTLEVAMDGWPGTGVIWLPRPPLVSVTSISYTLDTGATSTFSNSNYLVDTRSPMGRIVLKNGQSWPSGTLAQINGVVVRYVAGYGTDPASVPQELRWALKMMVGHWYNYREASAPMGNNPTAIPLAVADLIANYRMFGRTR